MEEEPQKTPENPAESPTDENSSGPEAPKKPADGSHWRHLRRFGSWYKTHKKWSIPATILVILIIAAGVPWTRYHGAGLVLKQDFTIQVTDSTAHNPVSGATVSAGGISATTNGSGKAVLHGVKDGQHSFMISKKYYQAKTVSELVPILSQKNIPDIPLTATGRQVKISVKNLITGKTLSDVDIAVGDASAKTDASGDALLVLPAGATTQKGTLKLAGYNNASVTVQVSNSSVKENGFQLTPTGKVYFISNRNSGNLDVMKANLDGTDSQVVVAGTGNEETSDTYLTQSADGKYVALVAKRSASDPTPQLYVLSTADDKLLQADNGNAVFQPEAWSGDTLIYTVQRQDLPVYQQGASKIKAYNAGTGAITLLDQTAGSDAVTDANEYYSEVMVTASDVVYGKVWQGSGDFSAKQNSLQVIGIDGQGHQTLATYSTANTLYFAQHSPDTLYVWQQDAATLANTYSQYTVGGTLKPANITNDQFYQGENNYLFSADGKQTFWSETRDGKNALMVGDSGGNSSVTIASSSDYAAYGWYTDQYLLVAKDGSELYIMPVKGGVPVKITDYQATGYGNGY